jgi:ESS family glutamate:Na+ symporter
VEYHAEGSEVLIVAISVLFLGTELTRRVSVLQRFNIPPAVTGGILCSVVIAVLYSFWDLKVTFDMRLRDVLLLVFFSTVGLSARLRDLVVGGRALVILVLVAAVFLVIQNTTGVLLVWAIGGHPAYGLFGGSVSLAGGHGTAIAWGRVAEEAGLVNAASIGIAFATFGLIAGGMIGGPIAARLIARNNLRGPQTSDAGTPAAAEPAAAHPFRMEQFLATLLALAICVETGDLVNRILFSRGVILPGFLTAMFVGIVLTNSVPLAGVQLSQAAVNWCQEVSLPLFLSISLMSMDLLILGIAAGPILLVLTAQVTVIAIFATLIVFRLMGRDYDAAVISAGFAGLAMGATPVGIANMDAITNRYGPSAKAFLVVPLVGAFFIDIVNAFVIRFFAGLPLLQQPLP